MQQPTDDDNHRDTSNRQVPGKLVVMAQQSPFDHGPAMPAETRDAPTMPEAFAGSSGPEAAQSPFFETPIQIPPPARYNQSPAGPGYGAPAPGMHAKMNPNSGYAQSQPMKASTFEICQKRMTPPRNSTVAYRSTPCGRTGLLTTYA